MNYKDLFTNNVLYITGVGRSGTTILGQIIASMRPVYYLFEPAILRPPIMDDHKTLRRNLFEDYFLNEICGRVNPSPMDWTYWKNHMTVSELKNRQKLNSRLDAINHIEKEKPLFVIKNPEAQHQMNELSEIFPGIRFIHILRNGFDVIGSSLARGWFEDGYDPIDEYCSTFGFEWMINNYADCANMTNSWKSWTPITCAACTWRVLTEMGLEYDGQWITDIQKDDNVLQFKYESFVENPEFHLEFFKDYGIKPTSLTNKHLQSVKDFKPQKYDIKINDIRQPERDKFVDLMEKLGYL